MKTSWILIFSMFLIIGIIGQADIIRAAGDSCLSTNGIERSQLGSSYCFSEDQGDIAINIGGNGQFVLAGGGPDRPSRAIGRNGSGAWAQNNGNAEATNTSSASAIGDSEASADSSSLANADNNSYAEATGDSSAIARTNSTAIATDGGCAYASGNSTAIAGSGEIVVVIDGSPISVDENNVNTYCRVWPPGGGGWPLL